MHRRPCRGTDGFSTLEVLVALVLIALIGLIAVEALAGGRRAGTAIGARITASTRLLQLDAALRSAVGQVRVPYWAGPVEAQPEPGGLSLRFRDGEETRSLRLRAEGGWITLDTVDTAAGPAAQPQAQPQASPPIPPPQVRLGPFGEASVEALFDAGQLWGVKATVRVREGDEPVEVRARIGSRPLSDRAAP